MRDALALSLAVTFEIARDVPLIVAATIFCGIIASAVATFVVNRLAAAVNWIERKIRDQNDDRRD